MRRVRPGVTENRPGGAGTGRAADRSARAPEHPRERAGRRPDLLPHPAGPGRPGPGPPRAGSDRRDRSRTRAAPGVFRTVIAREPRTMITDYGPYERTVSCDAGHRSFRGAGTAAADRPPGARRTLRAVG